MKLFLLSLLSTFQLFNLPTFQPSNFPSDDMLHNGTQAPDIMIDSASVTHLSNLQGRFVVLHFWASWCPDCRKDMPEMVKIEKQNASDSLVFIHISYDTDRERWWNYVTENNLEGIQLCELKKMKESVTAQAYAVNWIPTYYVLNTEGKVILATIHIEELQQRLQLLDYSRVHIPRSRRATEPTFPGGDNLMMQYLAKKINYPRTASNYGLEARTTIKFIVNTDGTISNVHVIDNQITCEDRKPFQRLAGDEKKKTRERALELFAEEAIRVVSSMPKWKPGVRNGIPIKVEYELPINFRIDYQGNITG